MCWLLISHETTRKKSLWAKLRLLYLCMNNKCLPHSPRVPNEGIIKVSYKVLGPGLRGFEAGLIRSNGQCVYHVLANISQYLLGHRLLGAPPVLWFSTFVGIESDIWISNRFPWSGPRLENHYLVHYKCLCFLSIFSSWESCSSILPSQHRQGYPCGSVTDKILQSTWKHYFIFPPKESFFDLGVKSEAMTFNSDPLT